MLILLINYLNFIIQLNSESLNQNAYNPFVIVSYLFKIFLNFRHRESSANI